MEKKLSKINEQSKNYANEVFILKKALELGCIAKYTWFTPDKKPLRYTVSGKPIIYGKSDKTGDFYYFYANMKVQNVRTAKIKDWDCDFVSNLQSSLPPQVTPTLTQQPQTPNVKPLTQNQKDLLTALEADGWYVMDPPPSDFKIAQGEYEKEDLTKAQDENNPGFKYQSAEYFKAPDFKEFFVYKKKIQQPEKVTKGEKVNYPMESCKIAINGLWKNLNKPRTFPLDDSQRLKYEEIARGCKEKVMVNFILKDRLNKLNL